MSLFSQKIEDLTRDLVKDGMLTPDQLAVAEESKKNLGGDLADILVKRGFVQEKELIKRLGKKNGFSVIALASYKPDADVLTFLTAEQAHRWRLIPLFEVEGKLSVATADPFDLPTLDEAHFVLGRDVDCVLTTRTEIDVALKKFYGEAETSGKEDVEVVRYGEASGEEASPVAALQREAQAAKVVTAVNQIFKQACREQASDIHLEPTRTALKTRLRIDGTLIDLGEQPKKLHAAIVSRIKILGNMDVAERRLPQDGRVRLRLLGKEVDLRIATYPTIFGEAAAIRLLSKDQLRTLHDLGFSAADEKIFQELITKPYGILLVTGPTGSGKSTTLYAALQAIDRKAHHVLSVEDPVEHEIEGVSQTQINTKAGVTFASTLRSMLREDPDVIMVGEIRDQETADIALRAAMTGHLVFSTLHTNTAVGAVARLVDLNVEPYLVASTVVGLLSQRLVRRLCPKCKEEVLLTPKEKEALGPKAAGLQKAWKAKGCRECRMTGFKGRIGIFELVRVDDEMRVLMTNSAHEVRLRERAFASGAHSLLEDGIEKIKNGVTTIDEVVRVAATLS